MPTSVEPVELTLRIARVAISRSTVRAASDDGTRLSDLGEQRAALGRRPAAPGGERPRHRRDGGVDHRVACVGDLGDHRTVEWVADLEAAPRVDPAGDRAAPLLQIAVSRQTSRHRDSVATKRGLHHGIRE